MRLLLLTVVVACCSLHAVTGRSSGPPAGEVDNRDLVCREMTPNPVNHGAPQSGNGGYMLSISPELNQSSNGFTYLPNTTYEITLSGGTLRGFLIQARMPGNAPGNDVDPMLLGSFTPGADTQKNLNCDLVNDAATTGTLSHASNLADANSVSFSWISPSLPGEFDFYYTVVQVRLMHYDAISARVVGVTTPPPDLPTADPNPTMMVQPTLAVGDPSMPSRSPEDYRLRVMNPDGCSRSECDLFIGIDTNAGDNGFLDIYMEGTAGGWLAVGFSETGDMFGADVVSCLRNPNTNQVTALDGWNPQSRASTVDTIQDVLLFSGSYMDNRISCSVVKRIEASGSNEDLDLAQQLFIIYARRLSDNALTNGLQTHSEGDLSVRGISDQRYNPSISSNSFNSAASVGGNVFVTVPILLAVIVMVAFP